MKINVEFNTVEEMKEFGALFATLKAPVNTNKVQVVEKAAVSRDNSPNESKEKVKAEVVGVDTSANEKNKDNEIGNEKSADEEPSITKEMVRDIFSKLLKAGKGVEAKALTTKYGANKIPEIKEEDYKAIYAEAKELIG